ncbi:UNVERIFIED_CONTAM: DExH-box ATP-dependent RNA helicase DExH13 [Sesamum calycinum]|uniref:DExH-box ATP-dependent RNA helicase DExH13 n=1 Tax=Sesamum calycinum TaxID=2727403 RepID=A0AAW2PC74_9LAMI
MLLQLPHFTKELAKRCQENPGKSIETVFDLVEMEDDERRELLQMSDSQLMDIARFCNRFPNIDLTYEVLDSDNVGAGEDVSVHVSLNEILKEGQKLDLWMHLDILNQKRRRVVAGEPGKKTYTLYFMCDSYLGCDQEYSFTVDVKEAANMEEDS